MKHGMLHMYMDYAYITCYEYIQLDIVWYMYVYYICAVWYGHIHIIKTCLDDIYLGKSQLKV